MHLMKLNNVEKAQGICFNFILHPLNSFCVTCSRSTVIDRDQKIKRFRLGVVIHAYNCSHSGGRDQEDHVWRPAQAKRY
jgi:hypothetical protein